MSEPRRESEPVLLICYGDGRVEVYAHKHVSVKVICPPYEPGVEGDLAAERFIDQAAGMRHREVFWPDLRRAMTSVDPVSEWQLEHVGGDIYRLQRD